MQGFLSNVNVSPAFRQVPGAAYGPSHGVSPFVPAGYIDSVLKSRPAPAQSNDGGAAKDRFIPKKDDATLPETGGEAHGAPSLPVAVDKRTIAQKILSHTREKDEIAAREILNRAEVKKRIFDTLRKLGVLSPAPAAGTVCKFELAVFRANGKNIPERPVWSTDKPLDKAPADVRRIYENFFRLWEYSNKLWDQNKLLQKIYPQGLNFCQGQFVVILDYDPEGGDEGYANASASRGENGEIVLVLGKGPRPGSDAANVIRPVAEDPSVYSHEFGHSYFDSMFSPFNSAITYCFHPGAGMHESAADIFAMAARQALWLGGRMLTDAPGSTDFKIGDVFIIDGALRDMLNPGQARGADHPFGPDLQKGNHRDVDYNDPTVQAILSGDQGGVHELASVGNRAGALTALAHGGDAQVALHILLGALALAAANHLVDASYHQQAQLRVASAYLIYGEKAAQIQREIWEKVGIFTKDTPGAKEMIAKMGLDKIKL